MNRKEILFFAAICLSCLLSAQLYPQNLAVSSIPENISKGANSVIRNYHKTISFPDDDKMTENVSLSLTILNEKSLEEAHLIIPFNKGEKVTVKKAEIYNAAGVRTKSIKDSDMIERSAVNNASLYNDNRVIYCRIIPISYPFTIVYEYEISYNRLYTFEFFSPYISDLQGVERSALTLDNSGGIPVKVSKLNLPEDAPVTIRGTSVTWDFSNLEPLVSEPYEPHFEDYVPTIIISPEVIQYNKYKGKCDTWANFGSWISQLSAGRTSLNSTTVARLQEMTSGASSDREKASILYKYLQSRTHYINISLGIGGLQPHHATEVDELGYGDCKDLSNYMVAMLKAVGIESYYTLVKAGYGRYNFQPDQPGHQFNHAIVCIPQPHDTIWLECTSQTIPFGYLGDFTDNRPVLLIKNNTGILAHTPEYRMNENHSSSLIRIDYSDEGTAAACSFRYSGLLMDEPVTVASQNNADQLLWLNSELEINDFTVIDHKFEVSENTTHSVSLKANLALHSFFTGKNERLFASLNLNNQIGAPKRMRTRLRPLYLPVPYSGCDTLLINLPAGFIPEQLPESQLSSAQFGNYTMQTSLIDHTIQCIRRFEFFGGTFPATDYAAFYDFMQKVSVADAKQLVLIRQ